MLRLLIVWAAVAAQPVIVLPRPPFHAPATGAGSGNVHFEIVSSAPADPARDVRSPSSRPLRLEGPDGSTQHVVVSPGRYAYDFWHFACRRGSRPASVSSSTKQVVFAKEAGGVLYVETAHSTYAKSSYGLNAYLNAVDLKTKKLRWRSPALVANAGNFVLLGETSDLRLRVYVGAGLPVRDRPSDRPCARAACCFPARRSASPATGTSSPSTPTTVGSSSEWSAPDARRRRPDPRGNGLGRPAGASTRSSEIVEDGPVLLLFYLFDWTST